MAHFTIVDYVALVVVLLISFGIGIFFGRKRQGSLEYTTGNGQMGVIPVGLSTAVTFISANTVQVSYLILMYTPFTSSHPAPSMRLGLVPVVGAAG